MYLETEKTKDHKLDIKSFKFHHDSKQNWEFKIITEMKSFENTYLVQRSNNTGSSCIRIINEEVLEQELKPNTTIKAQVCGIVMLASIYKNENEYRNSVKANKNGNKVLMKDGYLIPYNLITNNDAKLSEKERNQRNHSKDNLLTFKAKIKKVYEKEIKMFGLELPKYYMATIDTTFGDLDIIIPNSLVNKTKIENDSIIIGELLLSCNVCIDKYKTKIKKRD